MIIFFLADAERAAVQAAVEITSGELMSGKIAVCVIASVKDSEGTIGPPRSITILGEPYPQNRLKAGKTRA